jgi:hypothetical protein
MKWSTLVSMETNAQHGNQKRPGTHEKALAINLELGSHGIFAEIGAGQEVAQWLCRVGGAAATVAKMISAYDMAFNNAIYGPTRQYVSLQRLETMLDHENAVLLERLAAKRGATRYYRVSKRGASRHDTCSEVAQCQHSFTGGMRFLLKEQENTE